MATLLDQLQTGDRRALARALTAVENELPEAEALLRGLPPGACAHRIGITGPPGAGKSTLVSALTARFRARGRTVGVIAVDPTSPYTGGALLGDRVRMLEHSGDDGVFIRSLATRGALGGLAAAVYDAADLFDAAGFDPVLIETVGVGQGEVEICRVADTTVVVLAPGAGDDVQGMKAGLLEVADVLVVNQADRDGADALAAGLEAALELRTDGRERPTVLRTIATTGDGVEALAVALEGRGGDADSTYDILDRRRQRARTRLELEVVRRLTEAFVEVHDAELEATAEAIADGEVGFAEAVALLLGGDDE